MKFRAKYIPIYLAVFFLIIIFLNSLFFTTLDIGKVGVRINTFGGIKYKDYYAGYHLSIAGLHDWKVLDMTTHFLHFSKNGDDGEPLIIRTKDNNEIYIDVSIPYKIKKGEANKLIKNGLERSYQDRMKSLSKSILRSELAKLSPANIIKTDMRQKVATEALPKLNKKLAEIHIEAEEILIRSFSFINKKVEKTIQEKQYLRQEKLLKEAQVRENDAKLVTDKLEAKIVNAEKKEIESANKKIQILKSEYQLKFAHLEKEKVTYGKRLRAEGDAQREILIAEGKLNMAKAEALKIALEAKVLKSKGGKIFIAKQAAENLNLTNIKLNSNIKNPLQFISLKKLLELVQP